MDDETRVRAFRASDVDQLIRLAQVSFAEEHRAVGMTPEGFARQIRLISKGRLIPVRALLALGGVKWGMIVAEREGKVVGCGAWSCRGQRAYLHTNMVDPAYRRQGITKALFRYGLSRLASDGIVWASADVLANNEASLGNLAKQGFHPFQHRLYYERSTDRPAPSSRLRFERPTPADRQRITALRDTTIDVDAEWLHLLGDASDDHLLHPARRLMMRMSRQRHSAWRCTVDGEGVGYVAAFANANAATGEVSFPLVEPRFLDLLPDMLDHAATWLHEQGRETIRASVPHSHHEMRALLEASGYEARDAWLTLGKKIA